MLARAPYSVPRPSFNKASYEYGAIKTMSSVPGGWVNMLIANLIKRATINWKEGGRGDTAACSFLDILIGSPASNKEN